MALLLLLLVRLLVLHRLRRWVAALGRVAALRGIAALGGITLGRIALGSVALGRGVAVAGGKKTRSATWLLFLFSFFPAIGFACE